MVASANHLLTLSVVLAAGTLCGVIARRLRLPAVTGQILVGIGLGRSVFSVRDLAGLEPVIDFALGLMAVAVGSHLHLRRLRNAKTRLSLLLLFEVTLTPLLVFLAVVFVPGTGWQAALLMATIAISTAPATTLALVKETRSKGVFVKTLVAAVALNNLACIFLFEMAHTIAAEAGGLEGLLAPLRQLVLSAVLGGGAGFCLILATRNLVRPDRLTTASFVAILATIGLAPWLGISSLLACLFLGVTLANVTPDKEEIGHTVFDNFEASIYAVFFTLAGMALDFSYLVPGGFLALLVFGARSAGKLGSAYFSMRLAGATNRVRNLLGFALIPQAGLAVGLMLLVTEDPRFDSIANLFLAVVLTVVLLNEIVGPILTRVALARSGDFGKDRARVIDFLHEENIVTDLAAGSKQEAIEKLTDLLLRTTDVKLERDALVETVFAREKQASTCLGLGLAIPHAVVDEGDAIAGAMGISSDGLPFETPDHRPVHCMVLLVTPANRRDHHLEVLGALAHAVTHDPGIRLQLYHAKSPAHAYELLHAEEESEDFNYFLDDEEEV